MRLVWMFFLTLMSAMILKPVLSAEFNFNVPVEILNVHPTTKAIRVRCDVCNGQCGVTNIIGTSGKEIKIKSRNGNFKAKAKITFDAAKGKAPSEATDYRCLLQIKMNIGNLNYINPTQYDGNQLNLYRAYKPGSKIVSTVKGKLN